MGYTPLSAAVQVRLVAHLSRWMLGEGVPVSGLEPATVDAYFAQRRAAGYTNPLSRHRCSRWWTIVGGWQ